MKFILLILEAFIIIIIEAFVSMVTWLMGFNLKLAFACECSRVKWNLSLYEWSSSVYSCTQ